MKKYCLSIAMSFGCYLVSAQAIHVPAGKRFTVTFSTTSNVSVSVMGQTIDNVSDITSLQEYTVQSVRPTGYTLVMVPKKVSGKVSVMGQEQKFDSDDQATTNVPGMSFLNKTQEIMVEDGKVTASEDMNHIMSAIGMSGDNAGGIVGFFLTTSVPLKQGSTWADSTVTPSLRLTNQYVITAVTAEQVEVRVSSEMKMTMALKHSGVDMTTDMKGFSTSTRLYDKQTGLMISEKRASDVAGTADAMGITAPMVVKTTSQITIK